MFHISKSIATNISDAPIDITPTSQDNTEEYQVDSILDFKKLISSHHNTENDLVYDLKFDGLFLIIHKMIHGNLWFY